MLLYTLYYTIDYTRYIPDRPAGGWRPPRPETSGRPRPRSTRLWGPVKGSFSGDMDVDIGKDDIDVDIDVDLLQSKPTTHVLNLKPLIGYLGSNTSGMLHVERHSDGLDYKVDRTSDGPQPPQKLQRAPRNWEVSTELSNNPDRWADPKSRSTFGFCSLHHRSITAQNRGIYFVDPPEDLGSYSTKGPRSLPF